jgi:uncharacterized membrane protein YjfL (UPF0719 family)
MTSALKWGALIGVSSYLILTIGLALLNSLLFGNSPSDLNHPGSLAFACFGIFGILFAFSAAGYFTGRETRKVGWGVTSAMLALIVYYVLGLIYTPGRSGSAASTTNHLSLAAQVLSSIVAAIIVLLIAACMGWLGARPGIQQAQKRLRQSGTPNDKDALPAPDAGRTSR